jgi:hypothetical protein
VTWGKTYQPGGTLIDIFIAPGLKKRAGAPAGVQDGEQPDFRCLDEVRKAAGKTVEVQASHIGETDCMKLRVANQAAVAKKEINGKLQPQTRLLVFIPVEDFAWVSANDWMSS